MEEQTFGRRMYSEEDLHTTGELLQRKLGAEHLSNRPGAGNQTFTYVEGWKAIELANSILSFNGWSCSIAEITPDFVEERKGRYSVGMTAVVRITLKDGSYHEDVGFGSSFHPSRGEAIQHAKKEAVTDARKRCLRLFGNALGNCVYDKKHLKAVKSKAPISQDDLLIGSPNDIRHVSQNGMKRKVPPSQRPMTSVSSPAVSGGGGGLRENSINEISPPPAKKPPPKPKITTPMTTPRTTAFNHAPATGSSPSNQKPLYSSATSHPSPSPVPSPSSSPMPKPNPTAQTSRMAVNGNANANSTLHTSGTPFRTNTSPANTSTTVPPAVYSQSSPPLGQQQTNPPQSSSPSRPVPPSPSHSVSPPHSVSPSHSVSPPINPPRPSSQNPPNRVVGATGNTPPSTNISPPANVADDDQFDAFDEIMSHM
mmetsp:Transcript_20040/g.27588  ORF Transcript_20040/g.27588 Transcript_20040/m.27588 type:complete len:425 (+) Transcript_20040:91-1365(+)